MRSFKQGVKENQAIAYYAKKDQTERIYARSMSWFEQAAAFTVSIDSDSEERERR